MKKQTDITFICPQCHNRISRVTATIDMNVEKFVNGFVDTWLSQIPNAEGECDCGYNGEFIELDTDIVECIIKLNEKGWRTRFSCVGHKDERDAYIYFYDEVGKYASIFDTLPLSWYLDLENLKSTLPMYDFDNDCYKRKTCYVIRSEFDNTTRIKDLEEWIDTLPDIV